MKKTPRYCVWSNLTDNGGSKVISCTMLLCKVFPINLYKANADDDRTCVECAHFVQVTNQNDLMERETWE